MPELGDGILGRHLLVQSVRLGPGEFHSLREYVPGDEPRTIHWRASARSDELKVRQYSAEGLRRCTVVLDQQVPGGDGPRRGVRARRRRRRQPRPQRRPARPADPLRHHRRRRPARADRLGAHDAPPRQGDARPVSRHARSSAIPGEGLGLVFVITPSPDSDAWHTLQEMRDPSLTLLGVFTESPGTVRTKLYVDARSETALLESWASARRPRPAPELPQGQPARRQAGGGRRSRQRDDGARRAMTHTVAPPALDRESRAPGWRRSPRRPTQSRRPTSPTSRSASTSPPRSG